MRHRRRRLPTRSGERRRLGVEHEFQLFDDDRQLDARTLLPGLQIDGDRLDPGDVNAIRCDWGGVITADGREAEVATPPTLIGSHGVERAADLADLGAAMLADALPSGITMRGYSTHINVEIDDRHGRSAARMIVDRAAPAIMLMLDDRDSPGLLVRPRHRRLEFGGEYQRGEQLRAALGLAAAMTIIAERACSGRRTVGLLPPKLAIRVVPSPQRFGWYVDRRAAGEDLYAVGRDTPIRTARGRVLRAQDVLEMAWAAARPCVMDLFDAELIDSIDGRVDGVLALPCERSSIAQPEPTQKPHHLAVLRPVRKQRVRGAVTLEAVAATWHAAAFRASSGAAERWIRVPGERVDEFVDALDSGQLDQWLAGLFPTDRRRTRRQLTPVGGGAR